MFVKNYVKHFTCFIYLWNWLSLVLLFRFHRNSQRRYSIKKVFLNILSYRPEVCNLIQKRLRQRSFPMNFAEFLWTPILYYDFRSFCILRKPLRNLKNIQRKRVESVIYVNFFTFTFCYVVEKRLRPNILWEKCNLKTQITNTKTQTHEHCIHKFWFWSFFLTFLQNNFLWYF